MTKKNGCDVPAKQMFRIWMKTLLHCLVWFGLTQVNQMTYELKVAKCKSHGKNIVWICWSPLPQHYKKLG